MLMFLRIGEVSEWLNEPVSKTGMPKGIASSNLALSAKIKTSNSNKYSQEL